MFSGFWDGYAPAIAALINADYDSWMKENSKFFPKIAKCDFHSVGPSGSIQNYDAMCVLTLNILNEKLFAFLWVYLLVLTSISCFSLLFRLLTLISVRFRQHLVLSQLPATKYKQVKEALKKCRNVGDWFMLYQLSRNLNPIIFRDLMLEMSTIDTIEQRKIFESDEKFV
jgi:innexin